MLRPDPRFDRRAAANADMCSRGAVPFREQYTFLLSVTGTDRIRMKTDLLKHDGCPAPAL